MSDNNDAGCSTGCFPLLLGVFIAGCLSYKLNGDVVLAFFHCLCNWFYVVYEVVFDWKEVLTIFN